MGVIGKIIKSVIKDSIREIQLEIYEGNPIPSNQVSPPGIDSIPLPDDQGVAIEIENNPGKMVQVGVYPEPLAEPGEIRFYSRDADGVQQAEIWLKKDGTITINSNKNIIVTSVDPIELNGNGDNAVGFSALKTAYEELQSAVNTFANAYAPGGPAALGTPPTFAPSSGDITLSKVDEVKLP